MSSDASGQHRKSFKQRYKCRSAASIKKPQLESIGKIIMPPSAGGSLASLSIDSLMFKLRNRNAERVYHCGVLEFTAEEGMIYMPNWMMKKMFLQEGDTVRVKNVTLPKGTYVKLQPQTADFLDIPNPKAILGTTFSCLTTGDSITVVYKKKKYCIDIVEAKPADVISIIEADYIVDVTPCLDYKEPEKSIASRSSGKAPEAEEEEKKKKLKFDARGPETYTLPHEIEDILFPHQLAGIKWLWALHCKGNGTGGILADDMGLGKTMQMCSFLKGLFHSRLIKSVIIVAPPTIISYWYQELALVGLSDITKNHSSISREDRPNEVQAILKGNCILLTTYGIAVNDINSLHKYTWDYMILDEGHNVKNDETNRATCLNKLITCHRIIITGTPIQNNLKELWALLKFCCPSVLGEYVRFKERFELPILQGMNKNAPQIERANSLKVTQELKDRIGPFLLRRSKSDIFSQDEATTMEELPPKQEIIVWLRLTKVQRDLYEHFMSGSDFSSFRANTLAFLWLLKNLCDHPLLMERACEFEGIATMQEEEKADFVNKMEKLMVHASNLGDQSCKMNFILPLLDNLIAQGHSVLVISQTRMTLDLIQDCLISKGLKFTRIDGTTPLKNRKTYVKDFQEGGEASIFLTTCQVGGVGLTLTKADRVILLHPSWNPSADDQSVGRAHRIGQTKEVHVYRLITCGTVEENIYMRQVYKGGISRTVTDDREEVAPFSTEELFKTVFSSLEKDRFDVSLTQLELDKEHDKLGRDESLSPYINCLRSLPGVAGFGNHNLLFETKAEKRSTKEREKEKARIEREILQKKGTLEKYGKTLGDKGKKLKEKLKALEDQLMELEEN